VADRSYHSVVCWSVTVISSSGGAMQLVSYPYISPLLASRRALGMSSSDERNMDLRLRMLAGILEIGRCSEPEEFVSTDHARPN